MSIIPKFLSPFSAPKAKTKEIGFSSDSLDIDKLSEIYALSRDRIGQFLETELGWDYHKDVSLNPLDLQLEVLEVDRTCEFSAIILTNTKAQKRFITSNPDLILESKKDYLSYSKSQHVFQIASKEAIHKCLKRFLLLKKALEKINHHNRGAFGIIILSLIDCLDLGAKEVKYQNGKYSAYNGSEKYEGDLTLEIVRNARSQLLTTGNSVLEELLVELGVGENINIELQEDGFKVIIGEEKVRKVQQDRRELKHILIVDDDQRFVDLLKRGISLKGFRVSVASTAKQAVEYLNTPGVNVDLVISDFHMPNHSGASLISSIRNVNLDLPIIGLTGDTKSDSHISFINAGVNAIVRKSDNPKVLFAWIYKFLNDEHRLKVA